MRIIKEYNAKLDNRKRLMIHDANYDYYRVREFQDGTIILEPRVPVSPDALTETTLRDAEEGKNVRRFRTPRELFEDLGGHNA